MGGSVSPATSKGFVLRSILNALPALKGLGGFKQQRCRPVCSRACSDRQRSCIMSHAFSTVNAQSCSDRRRSCASTHELSNIRMTETYRPSPPPMQRPVVVSAQSCLGKQRSCTTSDEIGTIQATALQTSLQPSMFGPTALLHYQSCTQHSQRPKLLGPTTLMRQHS